MKNPPELQKKIDLIRLDLQIASELIYEVTKLFSDKLYKTILLDISTTLKTVMKSKKWEKEVEDGGND